MRHTITGIDFGTTTTKVVIAEVLETTRALKVIGRGIAPSRGIKGGYIVNVSEAAESLRSALNQAETEAGVRVTHAYVAVGGVGIDELRVKTESALSKHPRIITEEDVQNVISLARAKAEQQVSNKRIIHEIPLSMTLDGAHTLGSVVDQKGKILSAETLFIFAHEQHIDKTIEACEEANIEVIDVMAAPLAASLILLNKMHKTAGSALLILGSDTTTVAVFDEGIPTSVKVLPIGSQYITDELALTMKIPLDEAERLKKNYHTQLTHPRKKVALVVERRIKDILKHVAAHLKTVPHGQLLPAGIYLAGGGSHLHHMIEFTKSTLKLPVAQAEIKNVTQRTSQKEVLCAIAHGMCIFGYEQERDSTPTVSPRALMSRFMGWFRQFLP
ncbi:MAG: hypothetical protein RI911_566 [Candidatus Parcubacteria bacterium]|jgi:cell division protein FtsA